ncbi:hypothetical protein N7468_005604 [Penicillium chermesinum]|uniref:N-acetyltransferase domain-containing protein n=1 Tax=Penicillium chermesinum TaxID=63820 RepID=A0A9W9P265_9EURO|nr:uncharacterized protein N7468_005604 [Penicillium chermesinum]KAJ5232648.1 hypothetical protein N7468_005604 [Penicillium chermesinum]
MESHSKPTTGDASDLVLGYAYLSPFREHLVSYAPTVEQSLFVHPQYHSRSIGTGLLNAPFRLVDAGQVHHSCSVAGRDELGGPGISSGTRVRNIIAGVAVDPEGEQGGEALRRWYEKCLLVEVGRSHRVGFKRGNWEVFEIQVSIPQ